MPILKNELYRGKIIDNPSSGEYYDIVVTEEVNGWAIWKDQNGNIKPMEFDRGIKRDRALELAVGAVEQGRIENNTCFHGEPLIGPVIDRCPTCSVGLSVADIGSPSDANAQSGPNPSTPEK